jgi:ABC-type antimicrobial peptide transport system permease subunit
VFAVLLAIISIYSTVALAVARRQREIGIRLALGALPTQVVRMALTEAGGMVATGLVIGVLAWAVVGQVAGDALAGVLFNRSAADPALVLSTVAVLLIALLAGYVPARRASRTNLVAVMKQE